MNRVPWVLFGLVVLLAFPSRLSGQSILVDVVSAESQEPIQGVFVTLLSSSGSPIRSALTNASGRFLFTIPRPGTYRLRAEMIGRATGSSSDITVGVDRSAHHRFSLRSEAIPLEGIEVNTERVCRVRPDRATMTARVWEEARKALAVAVWGDDEKAFQYRIERYVRDLDREARVIESEERRATIGYFQKPFESRPSETLALEGYVEGNRNGDLYFAPDAQVLLSDEFLDTHCMALGPPSEGEMGSVGVSFEPIPGRRVPEISGTFWVEPRTGELQRLEYRYVNLESSVRDERVGGRVDFQRLPDGHWIVRNWWIRMPTIGLAYGLAPTRQPVLTGFREEGGEVLAVHDANGDLVLEADRGIVQGIVFEEGSRMPLSETQVLLFGTDRVTRTDGSGGFRFTGLAAGTYQIRAVPPMAAALGIEPELTVVSAAPGEVSFVELSMPPEEELVRRVCQQAVGSDTAIAVIGRVVDAASGIPIPDARVQVWWSDFRFGATEVLPEGRQRGEWRALWGEDQRGVETWSGESGEFAVCGPRPDHPLEIHAMLDALSSDTASIRIPVGATILTKDLAIRTEGTGSLTGVVVDFESHQPLASSAVTLEASGRTGVTDEDGQFHFADLPVGGYQLRVEMLGYATARDSVVVGPGQNILVEVRLPMEAIELEGIVVEVVSGTLFADRAAGRSLGFVSRAEIAKLEPRVADLTGVLRREYGGRLRIGAGASGAGFATEMCVQANRRSGSISDQISWRGCRPVMLVVDGVPVWAPPADESAIGPSPPDGQFRDVLSRPPDQIENVRFLSPVEGRFQYGSQGRFGVLIINTRRGGDR